MSRLRLAALLIARHGRGAGRAPPHRGDLGPQRQLRLDRVRGGGVRCRFGNHRPPPRSRHQHGRHDRGPARQPETHGGRARGHVGRLPRHRQRPGTAAGIPFLVTPGNHDASAYRGFEAERAAYAAAWDGRRPELTLIDGADWPFRVAAAADGVLLIGLDATRSGPLMPADMDWLTALLDAEPGATGPSSSSGTCRSCPISQGREEDVLADPALFDLARRRAWTSGFPAITTPSTAARPAASSSWHSRARQWAAQADRRSGRARGPSPGSRSKRTARSGRRFSCPGVLRASGRGQPAAGARGRPFRLTRADDPRD
jgi:hypothetical protein